MINEKHEWRKSEKELYLPKNKPVMINVAKIRFLTISGKGDPNSEMFQENVEALYALSYGIKMSYKNGIEPKDYFQYTVYPLEGLWDLSDEAKRDRPNSWKKTDLVYSVMIRQPQFVTDEFFEMIKENVKKKKDIAGLDKVKLVDYEEGTCCQMMHFGSYDDEPESFRQMEKFCTDNGYCRESKTHREIYISDPRKTDTEKLKTVLRFKVTK